MPKRDTQGLGKKVTEALGLCKTTFYRMKDSNPELFKYVKSFNADLVKGYPMYLDEKQRITDRAIEIYYELEEIEELELFGEFLVEQGIYGAVTSYKNTDKVIFKIDGIASYPSLLNAMRTNELYDEYRKFEEVA